MLGPGINQVILAIAFWNLPEYSRVIRASVLSIKDIDYMQASKALGGNAFTVISKHVLPNVLAPDYCDQQSEYFRGDPVRSQPELSGAGSPTPDTGMGLDVIRRASISAPGLVG